MEDPVVTSNDVPVSGLSGAAGSEKFYKITVPAGQDFLNISISGGTGDCDLYVKRGAKPTTTSWDYRPYLIGNNESVEIANPTAATWYIMLRAYQAYSNVTLVATYGTTKVGNDFTADPDCAALWRFESGPLLVDSIGSNTLGTSTPTANAADYKEGEASGVNGYFRIDDRIWIRFRSERRRHPDSPWRFDEGHRFPVTGAGLSPGAETSPYTHSMPSASRIGGADR